MSVLYHWKAITVVLRTVLEARESEYRAWANLQSLKSSLDEHNLELRVNTAIEAEAISQQRLAAAEAEIADQRQKWEASKRLMLLLMTFWENKYYDLTTCLRAFVGKEGEENGGIGGFGKGEDKWIRLSCLGV
ncbi:hypothetical protein Nepgr_026183 [Nepenthes gracilis]|uniref:E3 ubiquitin protein ligase n=1 Tax=Nepenthes gracilis TaxID=150966 RepID=A0AAD3T7G8_NEPGR|nr:hypothetical protein Nepgr_026183 [Nepenthes gracilis]